MQLKERINTIRSKALKKIEEAAKTGDTSSIFFNTSIVEKTEKLIAKLEQMKLAIDRLEEDIEILEPKSVQNKPREIDEDLSPRMKGEMRRNEFIQHLRSLSISLIRKSGSLFENQIGDLIGIAYASERQPDRWFLGLAFKEYRSIVLLCENEKGEVLSFIFPEDFYQKHKEQFSNVKGQIKFNIMLRGGRYQMSIPGAGNIVINEFMDNYSQLK